MNRMKIGVLLKDYKKQEGGAYSYYNALVEGIAAYQFHKDLEFVFIIVDSAADKSAPKKNYVIEPAKTVERKHFFLNMLNSIAKLKGISYLPLSGKIQASFQKKYNEEIKLKLIENEIDIVYSLTPYYSDLDYPTVVTHWDIGHKSTYVLPELIYNHEYNSRSDYYKKILPKAFSIFCESEAGKEELCRYQHINPERVHVVPLFPGNIIDIRLTEEQEKELLDKYGLSGKDFFIYPAQFWPHKNHFNLVMAFDIFNKQYPGTKLILSGGDMGNLKYIKALVTELELEECIFFPGFVSNEELHAFYKNAISMVMPTLLGPTNMPPIEAQALGCRIICSNFAGHKESLGDGPIYIDPLDREAIFKGMENHYLNKDIFESTKVAHTTINDALNAINNAFLSLAPIRKTYPLNFGHLKILLALWLFSYPSFL
ncbi:glycosyltransferase family 1 protein [Pedobacter heparinus]|uniref:glycosyltransferase family 4 protein n=1 Tax=Pedobacter heparinus TaxID=984 RepID=UPI00292CFCD3|nr:glycosyltransferase family 1 protein [Pedobacter heparinus]